MLGEKAAKDGRRHLLSLTAERNTRVDSRMRNASLFKYLSTQIPKFVVMCPFCSTSSAFVMVYNGILAASESRNLNGPMKCKETCLSLFQRNLIGCHILKILNMIIPRTRFCFDLILDLCDLCTFGSFGCKTCKT